MNSCLGKLADGEARDEMGARQKTCGRREGRDAAACEHFIAGRLKARFLPEVTATEFNYPVDIRGKWRGSKYSFVLRYRSGFADNIGEEFDAPFARLDYEEEFLTGIHFNVMAHRYTGQWFRLYSAVLLDEALRLIETDEMLQPHT